VRTPPPLLAAALALAGCDTYDRQVITVQLDRRTERMRIDARLENAGAHLFGCHADAADCAGRVRDALALEGDAPLAKNLRSLIASGAEGLTVSLATREGELDVLVTYSAWPGTGAADYAGVYLERERRRGGRTRAYLVAPWSSDTLIEGGRPRTRIRYEASDDEGVGGTARRVEWVFRPRDDALTLIVDDWQSSSSLLRAKPGLEDLLHREGLL